MNNSDNVNNGNNSNNGNNGNNKRYNRYPKSQIKKDTAPQKTNSAKPLDKPERNDRIEKMERPERTIVSQRNQFDNRHYGENTRNSYSRKYETVEDIQADIKRIEAEIRLEIKEIKSLVLGL